MSWVELRLVVDRSEAEHAQSRLFELGAQGTQEDYLPGEAPPARQPWDTGPPPPSPARRLIRAWFEAPDRAALTADLAELGTPEWAEVAEENWETGWQAGFAPLHISDRLVVAPPWDAPDGALIIDPGRGFGTGDHETTRAMLRAVDALADDVKTCLDVGCGSGILALAAAHLGLHAEGFDIDPEAIAGARDNAAQNGLDVAFSTRSLDDMPVADLVLANLHAELLVQLAPELEAHTGDWLAVAGILADREPLVHAAFSWTAVHREQDGEWVSLRFRRPR